MFSTIFLPLVRLAIFTALVRGGFLWLEQSHQIYVDRWIAAMIGIAETVAIQAPTWVGWTLAGTTGLLATTIWEVAKYRGWFPWQSSQSATEESDPSSQPLQTRENLPSPLSARRKRYIRSEFSKLSHSQKSTLESILEAGHGRNTDSSDWGALMNVGFVESDFSGPLGVKKDMENYIEELLEKNKHDFGPAGIRIDHVEHVHIHQDGTTKTATLEIEKPPPAQPKRAQPKTAYIHFMPAQMYSTGELSSLHLSSNISSIIDNGVGDFTFTFIEPLDWETLVVHPIGSTPRFRVVSVSNYSVNVKFDDGEPYEIGIQFDSRDPEGLADFLFSADELIKQMVSSNDDLNKWKQDYQEWNTNVTNFIRNNISDTQAYYFSNPGMVAVRQFDRAYNDEHNSLLNSLGVQRQNLRYLQSLES